MSPARAVNEREHLERILGDEFDIGRELGRGGMGAVYLAHERALDRPVAVKISTFDVDADAQISERLRREALIAAQLAHPHVVPVHRVVSDDDTVVIVMGYVEGESLADRVRTRGPLKAEDAARVLREIAWALGYAHARGIIHRDIKPENVLIERGSSRALVTDFGIAQRAQLSTLTDAGAILGSLHYMSPEQASGEQLTGASDLYSLGVLGFFALTGTQPIDGPSAPAILLRHVTVVPPSVRSLRPEIPEALAGPIARCLRKLPGDRYPTAEAFAEAVAAIIGQRVEIPPIIRGWIGRGDVLLAIVALWVIPVLFIPTRDLLQFYGDRRELTASEEISMRLTTFGAGFLPAVIVACLVRVHDLRRVLADGQYSRDDLTFGLEAFIRKNREEEAASAARRSGLSRLIRASVAALLLALAVLSITTLMRQPGSGLLAMSCTLNVIFGFGYAGHVLGLGALRRRLRLRFWRSGVGARVLTYASRSFLARELHPTPAQTAQITTTQDGVEGIAKVTSEETRQTLGRDS